MAQLLKNLYHQEYINKLAKRIRESHPPFETEAFEKEVQAGGWKDLELKARMHHITRSIHKHLGLPYAQSLEVLKKLAPEAGSLEGLFLPNFVATYGLDEDWKLNMEALASLTQYSSAEFAVRPFINRNEHKMMAQMLKWSQSGNLHLRRLASEGCRPRLPWGMALKSFQKDPSMILPILEKLKDDESEYVRRSVANNLNDISKDHPQLVLELAESWLRENKQRKRLVKHALRTLLKKGNTRALLLFGFGNPAAIRVKKLSMEPASPAIGEGATFTFDVEVEEAAAPVKLRIEYAIDFLKSNGSHSRKVFQLSEKAFSGGIHPFQKQHSFKQLSTRKHYVGLQKLWILVNGKEKAELTFELR